MKTSKAGLDLIAEFEGFSAKPYLCPAKVPTIGFGSTRYADGRKVTLQDQPISRQEASDLLIARLNSRSYWGLIRAFLCQLSQSAKNSLRFFSNHPKCG